MVKILASVGATLTATTAAGFATTFPREMADLIDPTADLCQDFYQYACGSVIGAKNTDIVKAMIATKKPKVAEFYNACMDVATTTPRGSPPHSRLYGHLHRHSIEAILGIAAKLSSKGVDVIVQPYVMADQGDVTANALYAFQADLPLDQSFFEDAAKWATIEASYREYISSLLTLAGQSATDAKAVEDVIITFQKKFANVLLTKVELMEAEVTKYNPLTYADAAKKYPLTVGLQLQAHGFNVCKGCSADKVVLYDLEFFDRAQVLLKANPMATLKTLVEFILLHVNSPQLSADFVMANRKLFEKKIKGVITQPSRERQADWFVTVVEESFKTVLSTANWLDNWTRANGLMKLSQLEAMTTFYDYFLAKANYQPVDKTLWGMIPQTVNAYERYTPRENKMRRRTLELSPQL
ncbi:hypothetical protein DYB35_009558 [Aphanomyces astaci]|uniref:Peptidase M13 N-terminal domain-containing protein n=1 Tax=Aphanomyces astaci TaxID=112090 RepID=A0A418CYZ2_APHAT|nr:hypothetical protein DYB35_009558 [Aphanomyces astaci]